MSKIALSEYEVSNIYVGDAMTVATVLAVLATAIVIVVVYKLFTSSEGKTVIPGGWSFQWK